LSSFFAARISAVAGRTFLVSRGPARMSATFSTRG
jgi:hypothetical protein